VDADIPGVVVDVQLYAGVVLLDRGRQRVHDVWVEPAHDGAD
jgi:hypothetical protein